MDFTEAKVYEAMGLPVPEGAQAQEVADPADPASTQVQTEEGAQGQEIADPAHVETDLPGEDAPETGDGQEEGRQEQSVEQRRQNAARRRQQEEQARTDAAVRAAVAAEKARADGVIKDLFARVGLRNTVTGQPITTMEEFDSYQQQFAAAKLQQDLQAGKLTPESLNQAISQHPMVKRAEEVIRSTEEMRKQQEAQATQARVDAQIAEIHAMDPKINTVKDLLNMPNYQVFYKYVNDHGLSLTEAFRLTNGQQLEAAKVEAAKQAALNNARGKEHLIAAGNARGNGAASVPADVMAMYRQFNPNASEAEILANWNKYNQR